MQSRTLKWAVPAAIAAVIIAIVTPIGNFSLNPSKPAYALEQTIEALKSVRFMHIVRGPSTTGGRADQGDERWIEIDANGSQARYRQETPPLYLFVDDRETVFAHFKEKNTVVLYDPKDQSWTWHYAPGKLFDELASDKSTVAIEEYVDYKGRPAHLVRHLPSDQKAYIDPETKLPIAYGEYEIGYEDPPEGIFDIPAIPEGIVFVDKRPGAEPTEEPAWMKQEREARKEGRPLFHKARRELAAGNHDRAIELLTRVTEIQPRCNWAWYWLGKAYYDIGEYEKAVQAYSEVCELGGPLVCYNLARGWAYPKLGMEDAAKQDFGVALPTMIDGLRHRGMTAKLFDDADDPLYYFGENRPTEQESLAKMINRLREITGQDFGFDLDGTDQEKEAAIAGWENWWAEHAADYGVSP